MGAQNEPPGNQSPTYRRIGEKNRAPHKPPTPHHPEDFPRTRGVKGRRRDLLRNRRQNWKPLLRLLSHKTFYEFSETKTGRGNRGGVNTPIPD